MTGPPTPPLSSALEIQDAARNGAPSAPASAPAPQPQVTAPAAAPATTSTVPVQQNVEYRIAFPSLVELAASGKFADLICAAEDLGLAPADRVNPDHLLTTVPLVLSYLIVDDLPPAQYALTRLPPSLTVHPISQALVKLVASAATRSYEKIYTRAEEVCRVVQEGEAFDDDFKTVTNGLLEKYLETFRRKTFVLISRAFTSIPTDVARQYLGCSVEQVLATANEYKWAFDASNNVLLPKPTSMSPSNTEVAGQSKITTLKRISIMDLE